MSLDLYVISKTPVKKRGTGVFVRENGKNRELSEEEAKERFPDADIVSNDYESDEIWHDNITHNLRSMAKHVLTGSESSWSLYDLLWSPQRCLNWGTPDYGYIEKLMSAIQYMTTNQQTLKGYNPENGWGNYEQLLDTTKSLIKCLVANLDNLSKLTIEASV